MFLIDQQTDLFNRHLLFQDHKTKIRSLSFINVYNISRNVVYNLIYAISNCREDRRHGQDTKETEETQERRGKCEKTMKFKDNKKAIWLLAQLKSILSYFKQDIHYNIISIMIYLTFTLQHNLHDNVIARTFCYDL